MAQLRGSGVVSAASTPPRPLITNTHFSASAAMASSPTAARASPQKKKSALSVLVEQQTADDVFAVPLGSIEAHPRNHREPSTEMSEVPSFLASPISAASPYGGSSAYSFGIGSQSGGASSVTSSYLVSPPFSVFSSPEPVQRTLKIGGDSGASSTEPMSTFDPPDLPAFPRAAGAYHVSLSSEQEHLLAAHFRNASTGSSAWSSLSLCGTPVLSMPNTCPSTPAMSSTPTEGSPVLAPREANATNVPTNCLSPSATSGSTTPLRNLHSSSSSTVGIGAAVLHPQFVPRSLSSSGGTGPLAKPSNRVRGSTRAPSLALPATLSSNKQVVQQTHAHAHARSLSDQPVPRSLTSTESSNVTTHASHKHTHSASPVLQGVSSIAALGLVTSPKNLAPPHIHPHAHLHPHQLPPSSPSSALSPVSPMKPVSLSRSSSSTHFPSLGLGLGTGDTPQLLRSNSLGPSAVAPLHQRTMAVPLVLPSPVRMLDPSQSFLPSPTRALIDMAMSTSTSNASTFSFPPAVPSSANSPAVLNRRISLSTLPPPNLVSSHFALAHHVRGDDVLGRTISTTDSPSSGSAGIKPPTTNRRIASMPLAAQSIAHLLNPPKSPATSSDPCSPLGVESTAPVTIAASPSPTPIVVESHPDLEPSTRIQPSSAAHCVISSLPLYVSARKRRGYVQHITYSETGGLVKDNTIGAASATGKAPTANAATAIDPLAAAEEISLIDTTRGWIFAPQKHTQAFKSHLQKKAHQAIFCLFAGFNRKDSDHVAPSSPSSRSSAFPSSAFDFGVYFAQFFQRYFLAFMDAYFPNIAACVALLPEGSPPVDMSPELKAVTSRCVQAMIKEARRLAPEADMQGAGCAFSIFLVTDGTLYTYASHFVVGRDDTASVEVSSQPRERFHAVLCSNNAPVDLAATSHELCQRRLDEATDRFIVVSSLPLHANSSSAAPALFSDHSQACDYVRRHRTPQETVARLVEARSSPSSVVGAPLPKQHGSEQPLLMTIIYL